MSDTYRIPHYAMPDFTVAVAKMNRKAARFGLEPITVINEGETEVEVTRTWKVFNGDGYEERSRKYKIPATLVSVVGSTPTIGDHSFIARVEYLGDRGESRLFHCVPGTEQKVDERFRSLKPFVCEHCNAARIRRDTFVVLNNVTGEQKQVGRQCLNDYTGLKGVKELLAKAASLTIFAGLGGMVEGYYGGGYFSDKVDTLQALTLTSAYIEMYGWQPKSSCPEGRTPTATQVQRHFISGVTFGRYEKDEMAKAWEVAERNPLHAERAAKVMAWVKTELAPRAKSDYEMNLATLVTKELAETRHTGIVCSAVAAYQRAMNQAVEYANRKKSLEGSRHMGTVGERMKGVKVTVQFVRGMASDFGAMTMVKFLSDEGNVLTWFATGDKEFTVGATLTIDGGVKKHTVYNGIQETQLTRVTVKEAKAA